MVEGTGETSNTLFETLEEWNRYLKQENIDLDELSPEQEKQARPRVQHRKLSL